jgi:uncharacterized protein YkwD
MSRLFFLFFLSLIVAGLAGCSGNNISPTQVGATPLPPVNTIVAATLTAWNTVIPAGLPVEMVTATPTAAAPTNAAALTATPQIGLPTTTAINTPTETPPAALPTPEVKNTLEPSSTPTAANPLNAAASKDDCIDKAGFYADVTVPDNTLFPKNTQFTKTWRFRNVGTCTWGDGYLLVFANGHIMDGPPSIPVPVAAPGDVIDISVNLKSPSEGGTYAGDWQFQNASGKRFGVNSHGEDMFWVIIKVDWGPGVGPTATPPPVDCAYERNPAYEAQILQSINGARTANGLPPLTLQNQLNAAALAHSADMACHSYLDHNGSDKSTHASRLTAHGYKYTYESENIFAGGDAQDAFEWWMNSPFHRGNILNKKATQIGIGYAYFASSQFGGYYTLNFARP